jgi:hypothetical protein
MTSDPRKLFLFLRDPDGRDIATTQDRLRAAMGARDSLFGKAERLSFCRIHPAPENMPRRPDDKGPVETRPAYDAAIIAEFASTEEARTAFDKSCKADWLAQKLSIATYLTSPIIVLDRLPDDARPAIKYISLTCFHDDMPDSAAKRSWAQHAKLGSIVHVGAGRYLRNWVETRNPDEPRVRGIVEFDFASVADLTERYFGIPGSMERIIQDVGHFVQSATRLYMREEKIR